MAKIANLDALIPREDFEVDTGGAAQSQRLGKELKLTELEASGITYNSLRKPDFQRETSSWDSAKVADFVQSFVDGDLIPAIIMWRSPRTGNLFVIDGAHRLSALIAWINDDYGAGTISRPFFQNMIEAPQEKASDDARSLLESQLGRYNDLKKYALKPEAAPDELSLRRGRNMGSFTITLQWVEGDAQTAETSFFKINQSASRIDETELSLIKARRKPNAIATRALIRAGTGHKYWSSFLPTTRIEVEGLAKSIYDNLFLPVLQYPIKTLDLPAADRGYTAGSVAMIFDLVNYLNRVQDGTIQNDSDGEETIKFLKTVKKAASRVFGPDPSSLGLHPGVYCYGATGRFQTAAFMAAIVFVQELEQRKQFDNFTQSRKAFEEFNVEYRYFVNQVSKNYGSVTRSLRPIVNMYEIILQGVASGLPHDKITERLREEKSLNNIKVATDEDHKYNRNFTRETKNAIFLREALAKAPTCAICGARLHFKAISTDHISRREDGGLGSPDNGQLTHPYCNTGFKERATHRAKSIDNSGNA